MRNDFTEIKKAVVNKNKDWLGTNDNTGDSQKEKIERGKEEESLNKIQKERRMKDNSYIFHFLCLAALSQHDKS